MSALDLDEIEARANGATEGPWRWAGNIDTGEPRLTGAGCDVLAIGHEDRSTTSRAAKDLRDFADDHGLDPEEEVERWAYDQYGEPIKEPRLWFYTDYMANDARRNVVFEVAPDAKTREDPRVYRADIVGIRHPDAEFIAAARTDIPALIARVRELEAVIERVEALHAVIPSSHERIGGADCRCGKSARHCQTLIVLAGDPS